MALLTDSIKSEILKQAGDLAQSVFAGNSAATSAAAQDAQDFVQQHETEIAGWLSLVSADPNPPDGKITEGEFASLMLGLKDLGEMDRLVAVIKKQDTVDTFASGMLHIAISVGLSAVLGPEGALAAAVIKGAASAV